MITQLNYQKARKFLTGTRETDQATQAIVREIIQRVTQEKDKALVSLTQRFDYPAMTKKKLRVSKKELQKALRNCNSQTRTALMIAKKNIQQFAKKQWSAGFVLKNNKGIVLEERAVPLDSVGIYVPGGRYPLVSTVLMCAIPAKVAGVKEIVLCTPPNKKGNIDQNILAAAAIAGVTKIFRIGGAQAIAALALGTEAIPSVCKIVGPGNAYVTEAKIQLYGRVAIDMPAGPTEVVVIARKGNPEFIAADMLAQAEHDTRARAVFITSSRKLARAVKKELAVQLKRLPNNLVARKSLADKGAIVLVKNDKEAFSLVNAMAPEHVELMGYGKRARAKVKNAGALFIGDLSCEVLGDYCSGTNHVLPTGGFARSRGGLSAMDFVKMQSVQYISKKGFNEIAGTAETLAELEGLVAHKNAVTVRRKRNG